MSIAKISIPSITKEQEEKITKVEKQFGYKRGPRMHSYDGGVFIDVTFHNKGPRWWVIQDHPAKRKTEKRFPLTNQYWIETYQLPII